MASVTNVGLLADLLDAVMQENKELFIELNLRTVIFRYIRENPLLSSLNLSPDFHIDASKLQDSPDVFTALGFMIFNIK